MLSRSHRTLRRAEWPGWPAICAAICAAICVAGLAGCKPLPPSKPASEFTPAEARGARVFQAHCSECHYPDKAQGKRGPGLQALTKLKSMPSGAPPTDERIAATILHGHGMMQAVPLPGGDLEPLLAYLHTL